MKKRNILTKNYKNNIKKKTKSISKFNFKVS